MGIYVRLGSLACSYSHISRRSAGRASGGSSLQPPPHKSVMHAGNPVKCLGRTLTTRYINLTICFDLVYYVHVFSF